MAANKVVFGNTTVIDITDTTATESDVANGAVFYKADGTRAIGSAPSAAIPFIDVTDLLDSANGTINTTTSVEIEVIEDGFVMFGYVCGTPASFHLYLDNVAFEFMPQNQSNPTPSVSSNGSISMPLKAGQKIKIQRTGTSGSLSYVYRLYGMVY